jgi:hypothetical protein
MSGIALEWSMRWYAHGNIVTGDRRQTLIEDSPQSEHSRLPTLLAERNRLFIRNPQ